MTSLCLVSLSLEVLGMAFCLSRWFNLSQSLCLELLKYFAYAFLLLLPGGMLALILSAFCKNLWVSLGCGVIGVFAAILIPTDNFILSLFPFALPFQVLTLNTEQAVCYLLASLGEVAFMALMFLGLLKIRRTLA